jgi:hypothetical protein
MISWKARLGLVFTMLAMVLAVSVPAVADHEDDFDDIEDFLGEEEFVVEVEIEDCELVSTGNDDFDEFEDEDELDGIDQDGDSFDGEDGLVLVCDVEFDGGFDVFDVSDDDDDDDDDDGEEDE